MLIDRYFYGVIPMAYKLTEAWGINMGGDASSKLTEGWDF